MFFANTVDVTKVVSTEILTGKKQVKPIKTEFLLYILYLQNNLGQGRILIQGRTLGFKVKFSFMVKSLGQGQTLGQGQILGQCQNLGQGHILGQGKILVLCASGDSPDGAACASGFARGRRWRRLPD